MAEPLRHPEEAPIGPVLRPPLARRFGPWWRFWFGLSLCGLLLFVVGLLIPLWVGIGSWGVGIPHVWGFGIANYAWWIGIANGASLFAAILVLRQHNLRTAINRFAEAIAVAAVFAAALYPVVHLGRPFSSYWMFPYPATTGLWPQFLSPLTWDFWAILSHLLVTTTFWYVGLVPDLATLRDKAKNRPLKRFYGLLALGWRGSVRQWAFHQRAHRLTALTVIPMLFVMQSAVAFMFASTLVPDWHSTRQALTLTVSAFESGLAAILVMAHLLRHGLSLQDHIDDLDIDLLGRLLAANALVAMYLFAGGIFLGLLDDPEPRTALLTRLTGSYSSLFWIAWFLTILAPLPLLWSNVRRQPWLALAIGGAVLAGTWLERVSLVVGGLPAERIGLLRANYSPTAAEWILFLGSAGLVLFFMLGFARLLPTISLYETRHDQHAGRAA